jgi:energy-dependent translational throttle protein EttA
MDGVGETAGLLDPLRRGPGGWADPDADYEKLGAEQAELEARSTPPAPGTSSARSRSPWTRCGCPAGDADVTTLSGGERRRVALCRLLLSHPDLLLLDEPTNHLDAESVAWLERFLQDYAGTVVAITHDRYFLDNVAGWILELDRGRGIPFEGNYSGWLEQKQARLAQEEKPESARQRTLERELEWVRMAPKARQAKGKARLAAYDKLLAEAKAPRAATTKLQITIPRATRLGDVVIEADHLSQGLRRPPAHRGPLLLAAPRRHRRRHRPQRRRQDHPVPHDHRRRRSPTAATIRVGSTVSSPTSTSHATPSTRPHRLRGDHRRRRRPRGRRPRDQRPGLRRLVQLQGLRPAEEGGRPLGRRAQPGAPGQGARSGGNVLLLDEPTNDLDVDTLRALEDALEAFAGCAVVISHDRWFLDRVATHMLAFEGDSQVRWFEGNFSDYEAFRRKELGAEADQPHRIKYKPLTSPSSRDTSPSPARWPSPAAGLTLGTARRHVHARGHAGRAPPRGEPQPTRRHQLRDRRCLGGVMLPLGSAGAKAMAVVLGEADIYAHAGGQYEWDSCAPVAVAAAAGLHVSRIDGSPLPTTVPTHGCPTC